MTTALARGAQAETRPRTPHRTAALTLLAALLMAIGLPALSSTAHAADGSQVTFDSIAFENEEFAGGSRQEIAVAWHVDGEAQAPLNVIIPLPEDLRGYSDRFTATGPGGVALGECTVSATQVVCAIDEDYIAQNPLQVSGTFTFLVDVNLYNTTEIERTFTFGEFEAPPVTITPNPAVCQTDCEYAGSGAWKGGSYNNLTDEITWTVQIPAPTDGMESGLDVSVTDVLDPEVFELVDTWPRVREARHVSRNPNTNRWGPSFVTSPAGLDVTVSPDGQTVDWTTRAGHGDSWAGANDDNVGLTGSVYQVQWRVKALDLGKAREYANSADYTIEGQETRTTSGTATRFSGSGTVVGTNFGKFAVTKAVTGDAVLNPMPSFQIEWIAYDTTDPDDEGTPGSATLRAGEPFFSAEFFRDSRIVLTEVAPSGPTNVTWENPRFIQTDADGNPVPGAEPADSVELVLSSANGNLGQVTYFALTNEANVDTTTFEARKSIENLDGVDVSGIDAYTLSYSYPAGPTWAAGGGTLELPADGNIVTGDDVPIGAEITFSEIAPPAIPGATWQEPEIDPVTIVAGEDDAALITVSNAITRDVGAFSLLKSVSGDGAGHVPDGTPFVVNYAWPDNPELGVEAGGGEITVYAGSTEPTRVEGVPAGAVVTLTEAEPDPITGTTWLDPQFSENGFTIVQDNTVAIDLDNFIDLNTGSFAAAKTLEGTGAHLVDAETDFRIDYSYPAGNGFEAGEGFLVIRADGEAVPSGPLPYGAEVTLSEAAPDEVVGGTWEGHRISPETLTIGDGTVVDVEVTNAISEDVGSFGILKTLTGDAAGLVDPATEFQIAYAYPAGPSYEAGEGVVTVLAGQDEPVVVEDIPAGAVVTLEEITPDDVEGGTWQAPVFSDAAVFTIVQDERVDIAVENSLALNAGAFSVTKTLDGSGASLVPDDAAFTVRYSYPAGSGFDAGEGTLVVHANGTAIASEPLPYGAEVTLSEETPDDVAGASWDGYAFSAETVTIGDGTVTEVDLVNSISDDAAGGWLPAAGALASGWTLLGALLLVAAGVAALMLGRARRAQG